MTQSDRRRLPRLGAWGLPVALALLWLPASAQAQTPAESQWIPPSSSVGLGYYSFVGDGEASGRLGLSWYSSQSRHLLLTGRFWDHYSAVEAEMRWLRVSRSPIRGFFTISGIWQNHGVQRSVGGTIGGGIEYYVVDRVVLHIALAWQSLFTEEPYNDNHWFRLQSGLSLVPFG